MRLKQVIAVTLTVALVPAAQKLLGVGAISTLIISSQDHESLRTNNLETFFCGAYTGYFVFIF